MEEERVALAYSGLEDYLTLLSKHNPPPTSSRSASLGLQRVHHHRHSIHPSTQPPWSTPVRGGAPLGHIVAMDCNERNLFSLPPNCTRPCTQFRHHGRGKYTLGALHLHFQVPSNTPVSRVGPSHGILESTELYLSASHNNRFFRIHLQPAAIAVPVKCQMPLGGFVGAGMDY